RASGDCMIARRIAPAASGEFSSSWSIAPRPLSWRTARPSAPSPPTSDSTAKIDATWGAPSSRKWNPPPSFARRKPTATARAALSGRSELLTGDRLLHCRRVAWESVHGVAELHGPLDQVLLHLLRDDAGLGDGSQPLQDFGDSAVHGLLRGSRQR